jgi:large subunit ribosomal protein L17
MRHHRRGTKFGRDAAHRDAMHMNLAGALIEHGRIKTTLSKAKSLRPYVEKLVTQARVGGTEQREYTRYRIEGGKRVQYKVTETVDDARRLHARRIITKSLRMRNSHEIVGKLFNEIAPRFTDRPGGYTRIVKLGNRPGDAAPVAFIEWVDYVPEARHDHDHDHAHTHTHDHAAQA